MSRNLNSIFCAKKVNTFLSQFQCLNYISISTFASKNSIMMEHQQFTSQKTSTHCFTSDSDKLCNANEAYQYLIKKYKKNIDEKKSQRVFGKWQLAGEKASRVLGVLGSLTAVQTEKQKRLEEEKRVSQRKQSNKQR